MSRFYDQGMALGKELLGILALGLELPKDHFDGLINGEDVIKTCRAHRYFLGTNEPTDRETKDIGAHTDFGAITVLLQDDAWLPVSPVKDALVVNLGDIMARYTNDKYLSNLHRVVSPPRGQPRHSAAVFLVGNPEYVIEGLPSCRKVEEKPRYEPIKVGDHLIERVSETYY
ncbi:hypothetical protein OQA88_13481 [Cercophora sp. LCS_1]